MNGICDWPRCKNIATIGYMGKREMCGLCFEKFCNAQDQGKEDWAREKIKLSPRKKDKPELPETEIKGNEVEEIKPAKKRTSVKTKRRKRKF